MPSTQLEAGSSDRAVVTRERRWLVAGWNDSGMTRTARAARAYRRRAGAAAGARHGRLRASQAPSRVPRNSYRPWGHPGPLGGAVGALVYTHATSVHPYLLQDRRRCTYHDKVLCLKRFPYCLSPLMLCRSSEARIIGMYDSSVGLRRLIFTLIINRVSSV